MRVRIMGDKKWNLSKPRISGKLGRFILYFVEDPTRVWRRDFGSHGLIFVDPDFGRQPVERAERSTAIAFEQRRGTVMAV